jgi:hypothetical protein
MLDVDAHLTDDEHAVHDDARDFVREHILEEIDMAARPRRHLLTARLRVGFAVVVARRPRGARRPVTPRMPARRSTAAWTPSAMNASALMPAVSTQALACSTNACS